MADSDFIMENKNKYFPNSFSFSNANTKKSKNLMSKYGEKTCLSESGNGMSR